MVPACSRVVKVTATVLLLAADSVTVNVMFVEPEFPSVTAEAPETRRDGSGSSSLMVPVAVVCDPSVAPMGFEMVTVNVLSSSSLVSSVVCTRTLLESNPAVMVVLVVFAV